MDVELLEDEEEYYRIYNAIFSTGANFVPDVVHVVRGDNRCTVGFMAGFWLGSNHFYIQFSGVLPEYQKNGYTRYFGALLNDGVTYDCIIKNTNVAALVVALKNDFIPIGITQKENKEIYIMIQRGSK